MTPGSSVPPPPFRSQPGGTCDPPGLSGHEVRLGMRVAAASGWQVVRRLGLEWDEGPSPEL